jgi:hypothetical protein
VRRGLETLSQLLVEEMVRRLDGVDDGSVDQNEKRSEKKERPQEA